MNDTRTGRRAIILYAHGARDARWAEPFERLRERVAALAADRIVVLAFLEHMTPDLAAAAARVVAAGATEARVVPLFFGRGGHLRDDFPKQLELAGAAAPTLSLAVTEAAGESGDVQDALAHFALEAPAARA